MKICNLKNQRTYLWVMACLVFSLMFLAVPGTVQAVVGDAFPLFALPVLNENQTANVNSFIESEISGLSADKNIEISATSGSSTVYLYLLFEWITDNTGFSSDLKSVAVYDGTKDMYDESGIKTGEEPTVEELYCGETNSITSEHVGLGFNQTLLNKRLGVKITFVSLLSDVSEIVSITAQIIPLGDYDSLCEESTAALPILIRGKDFRDVIDPEGDGVQINNVLVALSKFGSKIDESDEDSVVDLAFILTMLNNFGK